AAMAAALTPFMNSLRSTSVHSPHSGQRTLRCSLIARVLSRKNDCISQVGELRYSKSLFDIRRLFDLSEMPNKEQGMSNFEVRTEHYARGMISAKVAKCKLVSTQCTEYAQASGAVSIATA